MISDIDLRCFVYDGYGKAFIKQQKMSPDAWLQMAFQLTFYRYFSDSLCTRVCLQPGMA